MRGMPGLAAACVALAIGGEAAAARITESTTYFMVRGATLTELNQDLSRRGPLVANTGMRHPGATEVKFDGRISYRPTSGGCEVATTELSLDLEMTLPKWQRPRNAAPQTVLVWQTLEEDIRRHELQHAAIAKLWLKKLESAIRNLRPESTCARMEAVVNRVSDRYLAEHENAQVQFDTIEGRDVNWRLRRALQRTMQEYSAR